MQSLPETTQPSATISNERVLAATPGAVFAAFEQPERLAQWWGPNGFTNTFQQFEFIPDGRWVFIMHAPTGANYPNECIFREIEPGRRIVIEHVLEPWFKLTVTLTDRGGETHLAWNQEFESPEIATRMRPLCESANEQVLDRLAAVLAGEG